MSYEKIFLGYSSSHKAYRVFNKRILIAEECIHIILYEISDFFSRKKDIIDDDAWTLNKEMEDLILKEVSAQNDEKGNKEDDEKNHKEAQGHHENLSKKWRYAYGHPKDLIIGDPF